MAAGLIVRNASGVVVTQINDRLTKMIGRVDIPAMDVVVSAGRYVAPAASAGSIVVPQFATARPFFFFIPNGQRADYQFLGPSVTISGTTLSWVWKSGAVDAKVRAWMYNGSTPFGGVVGGVSIIYGAY